MAKTLDVYLFKDLVGHLVQDSGGQMMFRYSASWIERSYASPLSQSLPLQPDRFSRKQCRGFFAGILPEESNREIIARNLGISARNDYSMLERIGGECAGAISFLPAGVSLANEAYAYHPLDSQELAAILKELPSRPLLAGEKGVRLSLAGAQDKLAVRVEGDHVSLPLDGAPSTHILKPAIARFEGIVFNEALCMKLASAVGISTASVEVRQVEDVNFLLVKRYDRVDHDAAPENQSIERVHQEDFCQALGIVPELKYQKEGGPSLKDCFHLLRRVSSTPVLDLMRLLDAVLFNYLVGNNDAHGKNFSLLYPEAGTERPQVRLTPLYDIVSTAYYPELTQEMAMKLGGEYSSEKVRPPNVDRFAEEAELAKPLVRRRGAELADAVLTALPKLELQEVTSRNVARLITGRAEKALRMFSSK